MTGGQLDLIDGQGLAVQANRQVTLAELAGAIRGEHESLRVSRRDTGAVVELEGEPDDGAAAHTD